MKIAVIGGGVSGLTCAWYLASKHQVVVYEANGYAGGHTETHTLSIAGKVYAVDTGFIVFNEINYPNFTDLLRQLGVEWQDSNMSFSAVNEKSGMEYGAEGLQRLLAQRGNLVKPSFYRMLWDLLRFYRQAPSLLEQGDGELTLGEYLQAGNFSKAFTENHIIPMACALWSASADIIEKFPLQYFLAFMINHRMLQINGRPQWKVVKGGSSQYVKKLLEKFRMSSGTDYPTVNRDTLGEVRLNAPVVSVRRSGGGAIVTSEKRGEEHYDAIIFACHSDQALALLQDASSAEKEILGAIPYQENHMILHSDTSVMPSHRQAWASWNARIPVQPAHRCHVSYWMNSLQSIDSETPFFVSLNCRDRIDPRKIWAERTYHHPVFTRETLIAQQARPTINGKNNSWYCGAYWGWGFHEDGVKSALDVVEKISDGNCHSPACNSQESQSSGSVGDLREETEHVAG